MDLINYHNSSLSLKPSNLELLVNHFRNVTQENRSLRSSSNLELLVNHFRNATTENSIDPEKISSSKYYDIEVMHNIEIPHKNKSLSLFYINTCYLNKIFDDLQYLWRCIKIFFEIIAASDERITK